MRAAIIVGGLLLVSSAFANSDAAYDGLEKFGATGLPQAEIAAKASVSQPAKVAVRAAKETPMVGGSLEGFGASGLPQ
jgi:hypothetical protein